MRLLLIAGVVIGLVFLGWNAANRVIFPEGKPKAEKVVQPVVSEAAPVLPPLPAPGQFVAGTIDGTAAPSFSASHGAPDIEAVLVYTFKNRPVPPAPFGRATSSLGSGKDTDGLELSVDLGSNSWIMRGPPQSVNQLEKIAQYLDVTQTEIDLDFLLCAVSESWLRAAGITAAYQDGASWLSAFSLGHEGSTLRLESNGLAVDLSLEDSNSSARLVSAPVVRCVTGEPWEFSADQQVPVESVQRSEGIVSTSFQYQQVGLGFSGVLQKAGPTNSFRLALTQRNGSADEPKTETSPPSLRTQTLRTSLVVEIGRWSCVGGVGSWKTTKKRRLLGFSESEEQDLLLIFVRPRDSLQVAPRAFPVGDGPEHLDEWGQNPWDLPANVHPLLPPKKGQTVPKSWEEQEREFVRARGAK